MRRDSAIAVRSLVRIKQLSGAGEFLLAVARKNRLADAAGERTFASARRHAYMLVSLKNANALAKMPGSCPLPAMR